MESAPRLVQVHKSTRSKYGSDQCCKCNEQPLEEADPDCVAKITFDEVMLPSDVAIAYKFNSNPKTGANSGCTKKSIPGTRVKEDVCAPNDMKDQSSSMTMNELVNHYADNQDVWINDFYDAWEKMLENGYGNNLKLGPDVIGI